MKPALQVQFDTCVFAVESDELLLGQSRHRPRSPLDMNLPASHAAHASASGMYPALHTQSVDALLAAGEVEKLGHAAQATLSTTEPPAEYELAAHCWHEPACGVKPAWHTQAAKDVEFVEFGRLELFPGHGTQSALPTCGLYVPARHGAQVPFDW